MFVYHRAIVSLATVLALVAMGMVAGFFARHHHAQSVAITVTCDSSSSSSNTNGVINASCTPLGADECSIGALVTTPNDGDICLPARAPAGTACTSQCYVENATTTACDAVTGECTGDTTECRGYCNATTLADMNQTIPFDTNWLNQTDVVTGVPLVWNYYFSCYWNAVRLFVLDVCWTTETGNTGAVAGCRNACTDYLTPEFVASGMDKACLITENEFLLDPNMTDPVRYLDDPDHLPVFRLCAFGYRCADLNQTAIEENYKRSMPATAKTLDSKSQALARELLVTSAHFALA